MIIVNITTLLSDHITVRIWIAHASRLCLLTTLLVLVLSYCTHMGTCTAVRLHIYFQQTTIFT